ncbi:MAG TPA: hypothetical protein VJH88_00740 [Candidatus Nanoarchaeia archaeon]|nr:hypothetical protein [Candidatus Nanoarchaeia archaeon]
MRSDGFITPEHFDQVKYRILGGPNSWLLFVACNEGLDLADKVRSEYESLSWSK